MSKAAPSGCLIYTYLHELSGVPEILDPLPIYTHNRIIVIQKPKKNKDETAWWNNLGYLEITYEEEEIFATQTRHAPNETEIRNICATYSGSMKIRFM